MRTEIDCEPIEDAYGHMGTSNDKAKLRFLPKQYKYIHLEIRGFLSFFKVKYSKIDSCNNCNNK